MNTKGKPFFFYSKPIVHSWKQPVLKAMKMKLLVNGNIWSLTSSLNSR